MPFFVTAYSHRILIDFLFIVEKLFTLWKKNSSTKPASQPLPPPTAKPKMQAAPEITELAEHVGNFTQYWGFKHIHGRIWLHLFVSAQPLDAGTLIRRTGVSKALMSMSLKELLEEKWIRPAGKSAAKTQLFDVNEDLASVLAGILRAREHKLLERLGRAFEGVETVSEENRSHWKLSADRIGHLSEVLQFGRITLEGLLQSAESSLGQGRTYPA